MEYKSLVKRVVMIKRVLGNGRYGFVGSKDLPEDPYISNTISRVDEIHWLTTKDTAQMAYNHCGATAVTNLAIYHMTKKNKVNLTKHDRLNLFKTIHQDVGNGPVAMIAGSAKKIFKSMGYGLTYKKVRNYDEIKKAIDSDEIVGLLLANGLFHWHWVLCIGYREYKDGTNYLQIIDNWNNTTDRFYRIHSKSLWFSGTSYNI